MYVSCIPLLFVDQFWPMEGVKESIEKDRERLQVRMMSHNTRVYSLYECV